MANLSPNGLATTASESMGTGSRPVISRESADSAIRRFNSLHTKKYSVLDRDEDSMRLRPTLGGPPGSFSVVGSGVTAAARRPPSVHHRRVLPLCGRGGAARPLAGGTCPAAAPRLRVARHRPRAKRAGSALGGRRPGLSGRARARLPVGAQRPPGLRSHRSQHRGSGGGTRSPCCAMEGRS